MLIKGKKSCISVPDHRSLKLDVEERYLGLF